MYGKAVVVLTNGAIRIFESINEADIADYLYGIVGDEVEESNGVPTYIEASSWCPMASRVQNFRLQSQTNKSDLAPYQKDFFKKEGKRK